VQHKLRKKIYGRDNRNKIQNVFKKKSPLLIKLALSFCETCPLRPERLPKRHTASCCPGFVYLTGYKLVTTLEEVEESESSAILAADTHPFYAAANFAMPPCLAFKIAGPIFVPTACYSDIP